MKCDGCGNDHAVFIRTRFNNVPGSETNKQMYEVCDQCGMVISKGPPDVYFRKPYYDENLGDEKNPDGQMIKSKEHKARIMREQGVREAGDRIRGSRATYEPEYGRRDSI